MAGRVKDKYFPVSKKLPRASRKHGHARAQRPDGYIDEVHITIVGAFLERRSRRRRRK